MAHIIFQSAKRRCYTGAVNKRDKDKDKGTENDMSRHGMGDIGDEEAWAVLDEMEGLAPANNNKGKEKSTEVPKRKKWLPDGIEPVLEELPKWSLLADVLQEIEEEMIRLESSTTFCKTTPHYVALKLQSD